MNNEMTAADRAALKPGDRVWIDSMRWRDGRYIWTHATLGTVSKVTRTLVVLTAGSMRRFTIKNGSPFPSVTNEGYLHFRLHFRATPEDIAIWEADKQRESEERQEWECQQKAVQDTGAALSALFADPVWVVRESDGHWNISYLTEAQVRMCAAALKPIARPSMPEAPE
jgi:hypothetical protein